MLRKMKVEDLDAVTDIDSTCFPVSWSKAQYVYEMNENVFAHLYVLEIADEIVGFIDFWITFEICQLAKIAVVSKYQNMHYAHRLMDKMLAVANKNGCENISLEVRVSNVAAHRLYENYNFIKVNVRKHYYQDNGEDADVLVKALGGSL